MYSLGCSRCCSESDLTCFFIHGNLDMANNLTTSLSAAFGTEILIRQ
jgi:hypothetical protein